MALISVELERPPTDPSFVAWLVVGSYRHRLVEDEPSVLQTRCYWQGLAKEMGARYREQDSAKAALDDLEKDGWNTNWINYYRIWDWNRLPEELKEKIRQMVREENK